MALEKSLFKGVAYKIHIMPSWRSANEVLEESASYQIIE